MGILYIVLTNRAKLTGTPQYLISNNTFLFVVNMLQKFIRMHIRKFELQLAPQQNNHRSLRACLNWVMELRTHFLNNIEKIDVMIYHSKWVRHRTKDCLNMCLKFEVIPPHKLVFEVVLDSTTILKYKKNRTRCLTCA